jgi:hypothetical protein
VEQSDVKIKQLEDQLRESNNQVQSKACMWCNTEGQTHTVYSCLCVNGFSSLWLFLVPFGATEILQIAY